MCGLHKRDTDLKLYFLLGETVKREKERERERERRGRDDGKQQTHQDTAERAGVAAAAAAVLRGAPPTDRAPGLLTS